MMSQLENDIDDFLFSLMDPEDDGYSKWQEETEKEEEKEKKDEVKAGETTSTEVDKQT